MARLMFSAGMFSALAAAMAPRRRGLPSGSPPPPVLAAMVISLMRRVKILPRLASRAPFLCLIVAHLEWPDMGTSTACKKAISKGEYSTYKQGLSMGWGEDGGKHKSRPATGAPARFPKRE